MNGTRGRRGADLGMEEQREARSYRRKLLALVSSAGFFEGYDSFVLAFVTATILRDLDVPVRHGGLVKGIVEAGAVAAFFLATTASGRRVGELAVVERKTIENLASSLSDGRSRFRSSAYRRFPWPRSWWRPLRIGRRGQARPRRMARRYPGRLQVRYPEVQVVFADSRRFAEEWRKRFLASALADAAAPLERPEARIGAADPTRSS